MRPTSYNSAMFKGVEKRPGPDWDIHYMDMNGVRECMSVFGCATPEGAIAEARYSLNALCTSEEERDQFEILAVIRQSAGIEVASG